MMTLIVTKKRCCCGPAGCATCGIDQFTGVLNWGAWDLGTFSFPNCFPYESHPGLSNHVVLLDHVFSGETNGVTTCIWNNVGTWPHDHSTWCDYDPSNPLFELRHSTGTPIGGSVTSYFMAMGDLGSGQPLSPFVIYGGKTIKSVSQIVGCPSEQTYLLTIDNLNFNLVRCSDGLDVLFPCWTLSGGTLGLSS